MNQKLINALIESNPWWEKGEGHKINLIERDILKDIEKYISKKQIISISGLRRVGKTTLFYYFINNLLKKINPRSILYFSFDDFKDAEIEEILLAFMEINKHFPKYVFFDEIQKVKDWSEKIKRIYDNKELKIFLSGSESLFIRKKTKETLAGRIYEFILKPLSFKEYLSFKGIHKDYLLHYKKIIVLLNHYLLTGGFPELINEEDKIIIRKYIRESIIDKTLFRDISELFKVDDPSILNSILEIIIDSPGIIIELNEISKELGIARQTLSKYLFYLEASQLIKKLYNYSTNRSTSEKKLKKYYLNFPNLALSYKSDEIYTSKIIENLCVLYSNAKFFWRTPQKDEVDIILEIDKKLMPIEIKYKNKPDKKSVIKFMEKYKLKEGYVITKDLEKDEEGIKFVPLWKWLLKEN